MKFSEYLKEQKLNEDATSAIVLSQALVFGSIFASLYGSGGKTINPLKTIKNFYKNWKINKELKGLTPDEMKKMQDEIKQMMEHLPVVAKGRVEEASRLLKQLLDKRDKAKGFSEKRDVEAEIAKQLEAIQKHIKIDPKEFKGKEEE